MCNLYRLAKSKENLATLFDARPLVDPPEVKTAIYPKYESWVVRKEAGERALDLMPWGIIRSMPGKRPGVMIKKAVTNVRNLDSPFWRSTIAAPGQRCLVPFSAFAEPKPGKDEEGRPANHWFTLPSSEVAAFAGIWRFNEGAARFAFLTCEPNPLVAPLHPKAMPVILQPDDYDAWLHGEAADACALAQPFPSQLMAVA
ncbi:MAG TPA: SOS response-associated peptidase family protein [Allosphingosinicella sp.]